ncbi:TniQ family protein [Leptolyngbya sp. FACHB-402]|nr:TniQ family protein [Leptolyngbya sp. FACHB-161]MBD2373901.1 TniQ family protein [Leptolyngbya sp. FACHB-238]MBD2398299.1 TniQ family protein [Leptolyngbya sp. FACHB-239]MBD2404204.1 TniQ family protein [Leptolyngbya sp. FACHB-402]
MEHSEIQPWFFHVEALEGESISHFLGRFRQANELTPSGVGKISGLGGAIARWEKFRFNPYPTQQQFEKLSTATGISVEQLWKMMPPEGVGMQLEPIRLCASCYAELPCHQIQWQFKDTQGCEVHGLRLLSECPNCKARFKPPATWSDSKCHRCFMLFSEMRNRQKRHSFSR